MSVVATIAVGPLLTALTLVPGKSTFSAFSITIWGLVYVQMAVSGQEVGPITRNFHCALFLLSLAKQNVGDNLGLTWRYIGRIVAGF
jgi:hypothetical protein